MQTVDPDCSNSTMTTPGSKTDRVERKGQEQEMEGREIRLLDLLLTALAPIIWGSTYLVTTELLPPDQPVTVAMLRALPAGLLLLVIVRTLPSGVWWYRSFLLGILNFTVFWICLFVTAYRLPGGVAATVGAVQPLIVILLSSFLLGVRLSTQALLAALLGMLKRFEEKSNLGLCSIGE